MKRLAVIFALLLCAAPAWAQTYVNSTSKVCTSATTCAVTYSPTAGNALVIGLESPSSSTSFSSIADNGASGGSAYTVQLNGTCSGGSAQRCGFAYTCNVASSVTSITLTLSGADTPTITVAEYSGIATSACLDQSGTAATGTSTSQTGNDVTTTQASELLIGYVIQGTDSTSTFTGANGFTARVNQGETANPSVQALMDKAVSSIVTDHAASTTGASVAWQIYTFTFKVAATFTTEQTHFRFRNDDGSESAATWLAAEDAALTQPLSTNTRLRAQVDTSGASGSQQYQLEYKKSTDSAYKAVLTAQPACVYQAAGTAVGGAADISPAWPAHQVNDIGLLFVESPGGQVANLGTPAGFAAVTNSPQATGATTAGTQLTIYWARATSSSMGAPTVTDPGNHAYGVIMTFRGCVQSGNPWDITAGGVKASASTSASAPAVTTTVANTLIVNAISRDDDAAGAEFGTSVAWANANLGSLTERFDDGTTSGNGGGIGITTGTKATAGDTGTTTVGVTSSINAQMTIALKPQIEPILITTSGNIAASAATSTTAQLSVPNSHSFTALRISDDTNPLPALTLGSSNYGEAEWNLLAATPAADGDIYTFRLTMGGTAFTTYTVTPQWTIGTAGPATRAASETAGASDSAVAKLSAIRAASETAATSDSATANRKVPVTASENAGASDAAVTLRRGIAAASETAGASDSAAAKLSAVRAATETAAATDAAVTLRRGIAAASETAAATDSAVTKITAGRTASETAAASDSAVTLRRAVAAASETAGASDAAAAKLSANRAAAETAGVSDAASALRRAIAAASETAGASDAAVTKITAGRAASEIAGAADAATTKLSATRAAAETAGASDSAAASLHANRAAAETAGASDSATGVRLGALTQKTAAESAAASDSGAAKLLANRSATETAAASDSGAAKLLANRAATETASANDSAATVLRGSRAAIETAAASDSAAAMRIAHFQMAAAETAGAADAAVVVVNPIHDHRVVIIEGN